MKYFIYGLLGALFVVIGSESYAASTKPFKTDDIGLHRLFNAWTTLEPSHVPVVYETIATTPQGQQVTRYTTKSTPLTKARLGSLARSAVGGPAVLAATAAFLAYDYYYNDDTEQWEVSPELSVEGTGVCIRQFLPQIPDISYSDCLDSLPEIADNNPSRPLLGLQDFVFNTSSSGTLITLVARYSSGGAGVLLRPVQWSTDVQNDPNTTYEPFPVPVSDSDLGDAIINYPDEPWKRAADILGDPISTGTWPDRWPEMVPVTQEIETQLGHDIEGGPAPVNPDQTITDSSTYNPPSTDTGSGGSMSTEWPTFCGWAGVVCDFIDWVQEPFAEPPPVEVPYVDIDFEEDYDSGIVIAQCPAPIAMNITLGSSVRAINFEWTPLCTFADTVRPLIIAFSYLIGIYILLRVK